MNNDQVTKVTVWFSIMNCGDGSAYPRWLLTEEEADWDQRHMSEGWGESCIGSVQTYEGADIHTDAVSNSEEMQERMADPNESEYD